jgi:ribose transport system permease protein
MIVAMSLASDRFLTVTNVLNILKQTTPLMLISLGLFAVLLTGNIDLTVGVFLGLSGALIAGLSLTIGPLPALLIVAGCAICLGTVNGFLATRGPNLSVIVTLAGMIAIQGITLLYTDGRPITGFPAELRFLGNGQLFGMPASVLLVGVCAIGLHFVLTQTVLGREFFAIGSNFEASRLAGVNTTKRIIQAFAISASFSALAGLVLIGRVSSAQPTAGVGDEFSAVGAVLIGGASLNGGRGTVIGVVAGVLILGMISNGLNLLGVNPYFQYVVKGFIILAAILLDQLGRRD